MQQYRNPKSSLLWEIFELILPNKNKNKCRAGIECLRQYRKEYDDRMQTFKNKPLHDWSSHGADAFRYGCAIDPGTASQWKTEINIDIGYIV